MDARAQLRRYLEQRREMGETELVLDSLDVEAALKLLGAAGAAGAGAAASSTPSRPAESTRSSDAPAPNENAHGSLQSTTSDWRAALRAAGAGPGSSAPPAPASSPNPAPPAAPSEEPIVKSASTPFDNVPRSKSAPLPPVPKAVDASPATHSATGDSLAKIASEISICTRCPLYQTALNPVPGEGNPQADLMCVGEAPGQTEDETGRPFVGAAGQLLTKILEAIKLPRDQVFICNVLKHRPPGNRNPLPEEVTACSPYLIRQIELVRPKVILALGSFAAQALLQSKLSLSKLRGSVHEYHGVPVVVTYHPAALLRNPSWKRPTWEDVQLARRILDRATESGA